MNRRSFFKSLSAAVAGTVVLPPAITFDRCWKYPAYKKAGGIWVVNPEWLDAPYELNFFLGEGSFEGFLHDRRDFYSGTKRIIEEPFPLRYREQSFGEPISPWIEL